MRPLLFVMVKEPRPGRVKTRLGREIGYVDASWWFRHQTSRLLRDLNDPRWSTILAVSPDRQGLTSRIWPRGLQRIPQGRGNLGDRMARILRADLASPKVIIGADIPGITRTHIAQAFKALRSHDSVIGPAHDGGYWLIGLSNRRAAPAGLFHGVRWSTEHTRKDTIATLADRSIATVATLRDIDTAADLKHRPDARVMIPANL